MLVAQPSCSCGTLGALTSSPTAPSSSTTTTRLHHPCRTRRPNATDGHSPEASNARCGVALAASTPTNSADSHRFLYVYTERVLRLGTCTDRLAALLSSGSSSDQREEQHMLGADRVVRRLREKRPRRWLWRRALVLASSLTLLLPSGEAKAEQECPEADDPAENPRLAGEAFSQGMGLYEAGDLEEALGWFRCSYGLIPHSDTLFNIGQVAEELGQYDVALESYDMLLEVWPDYPDHARIERTIARLRAQVGESGSSSDSASSPQPADASPSPGQEETVPLAQGGPSQPGDHGEESDDQEEGDGAAPSDRRRIARAVGWAALGLGLTVAISGGTIIGVAASENEDYLARRDDQHESREDLAAASELGLTMERAGWPLLEIGGATLVAAVVLLAIFYRGERAAASSEASGQWATELVHLLAARAELGDWEG